MYRTARNRVLPPAVAGAIPRAPAPVATTGFRGGVSKARRSVGDNLEFEKPWIPNAGSEDRPAGQLYLTAEYELSFVQWCWASMTRIVPDFERMTRLCVPAPSPQ